MRFDYRTWFRDKVWLPLVCLFKGHKWGYSLGWGKAGNYDEIWFVCDRCDIKPFHFLKSDVEHWRQMDEQYNRHIMALEKERDSLRERVKRYE